MAHECKYCGKPGKAPQGKAAHERNCPENPNYKEPKAVTLQREREQAQAENPENICPECRAEGIERKLTNPGSLASHRHREHGVLSPTAKMAATRKRRYKTRNSDKAPKAETNGNTVETAGAVVDLPSTPAAVRRLVKAQQQHREDLVRVVQIAYPGGIPTEDGDRLDQTLAYILDTAQLLATRSS